MKSLIIILILLVTKAVFAQNYYGFKTINILNLKTQSRCSGVLLKTEKGCQAVTNAHCVRDLALKEKNLVISQINSPNLTKKEDIKLFSKLFFINLTDKRSYLIKAKPSADLAELYFNEDWAPNFCKNSVKTSKNTIKDYPHSDGRQPPQSGGGMPQQTPLRGSSFSYRYSPYEYRFRFIKNKCYIATGFQLDNPNISSLNRFEIDRLLDENRSLVCPSVARLIPDFSYLPGLKFMYKVIGLNLSQGMSGGALLEIDKEVQEIHLLGLSASFYPFKWQSNFIKIIDVLEFLLDYEDTLLDNYNTHFGLEDTRVASDDSSALLQDIMNATIDNRYDNLLLISDTKEIENDTLSTYALLNRRRERIKKTISTTKVETPRVVNLDRAFGDTDQDETGDGDINRCSMKKSTLDPYFDNSPGVTSCFDLSQTRFQHSGVIVKDYKDSIIYGIRDNGILKQIDGLSSFAKFRKSRDFSENNLLIRKKGMLPDLEYRKNILKNFEGFYKLDDRVIVGQDYNQSYLNDHNEHFYQIRPSVNSLLNERATLGLSAPDKLEKNLFSYEIDNKLRHSSMSKVSFDIKSNRFNIRLEPNMTTRYLFELIPSFSENFSLLELNGSVAIQALDDLGKIVYRKENVSLKCELASLLRLICSNDFLEIGVTRVSKRSKPNFRVAFWEGFETKEKAFLRDKPLMNYFFGRLQTDHKGDHDLRLESSLGDVSLKDFLRYSAVDFYDEPQFSIKDVKLNKVFSNRLKCSLESLTLKTIYYKNEVYHLVHDFNKQCRRWFNYGEIFSADFKSLGIFTRGKYRGRP